MKAGRRRAALMLALTLALALPCGCNEEPEPAPGPKDPAPANAASAWVGLQKARAVLVKAADAFDLTHLMTLTDESLDGAPLLPGEKVIGCKDGTVDAKTDRREHSACLEVKVPEAGTYYPWVRVWWLDDCANSFHVSIERDGKVLLEKTVEDATTETWHWVPAGSPGGLSLGEGAHTVLVINTEDGAWLSTILFTTQSYRDYTPQTPEG
jgi:hypothetical protein